MVKHFFEKIFFIFGSYVYRYPKVFFAATIILTLLSIPGLMKIKLDSNLSALLPEDNPIVQNMKKVSDIYGGLGSLVIVVRGEKPDSIVQFFHDISSDIEKNKEVRYFEYKKPVGFFEKHLLLFMESQDIRKIYYRVYNKFEYERKKNNPLLLDFVEEKDPGLYLNDIIQKYEKKATNQNDIINKKKNDPYFEYYYKKEKELYTFAAFVKPVRSALSVKYSKAFLEEIQSIVDKKKNLLKNNEVIEYTGRYKKSPDDFQALQEDFKLVTIVSIGGVFLILLIYFRKIRSLLLIFIPLIMGILWTLAFVGYVFGSLNLITTFLSAILLGLGIDYGIHLIVRYREERRVHTAIKEPFLIMFSQTGAASFASAITTSFGFLALSFTEFKAFKEFGFIASVGIIFLLFSMLAFVPSVLVFFERKKINLSFNNKVLPLWLWKYPRIIIGLFVIVSIIFGLSLKSIWFDYDFSKIQGKHLPSHIIEKEINQMVGRTQNPTVILPKDSNQEKIILEKMKELINKNNKNKNFQIHQVVGMTTFIPKEQKIKIHWIKRLHYLLKKNQKYKSSLSYRNRKHWNDLYQRTEINEINAENLPSTIRRVFSGKNDHSKKRVILVFPKTSMVLGLDWIDYANSIKSVKVDNKTLTAASDEMIFAEILSMIQQEGPLILLIAFLAVVSVIFFNFMNLKESLIILFPLILGVYWLLGFMGLFNMPIDFFNVILFPVIFGIGIDSSIHIYHRYKEEKDMKQATSTTGVAVSLSTVTSMMGFGALMSASNQAIYSMGYVALWGLLFSLLASLFVMPAIIILFSRFNNRILSRKKENN